MKRLGNSLYREDLDAICAASIGWDALRGKTIAISGATGMIGTVLVDALLRKNDQDSLGLSVLALGRSETKARERLPYFDRLDFTFETYDVTVPGATPSEPADVVIHLASTTHPKAYATDPIGTITSNLTGLSNLLEYASRKPGSAFLFASSVEIYGESRGDVPAFDEAYLGYLDCNTLRAGYPEAKRAGEALCQAYAVQKKLEVFIPRLPRVFGPTVLPSDTKAISQFIAKGVADQDVVLKSEGTQLYSYLYVADAVAGLLWVLTRGTPGEAYNLADERCDMTLRDIAFTIAAANGKDVVFDLPSATEAAGYSTATRALLDPSKAQSEGWSAVYDMADALPRTIAILRSLR